MKKFFIIISLNIIFFFPNQLYCQVAPVWEDSSAVLNSIKIVINDDSLSSNQKLNLIYKFLEANKPAELLGTGSLTNAPKDNDFRKQENLQENKNEKNAVERTQCRAITKKGTRCSRTAKIGSKYCWQHEK